MILSMTGYGKSERKNKNFCVSVEIKSINNRFFDPIPKIHPLLREFEKEIMTLVKDECIRGRVFINLDVNTNSINQFILNNIFENNFRTLLKNVNTKGKNSDTYKDKTQSEILSNFLYDISLPLKKTEEKYTKFLTPKLSLRHSPNKTKNIQDLDRQLNIDNIFSLNRIGANDEIESGTSLAVGS